MLLPQTYLDYQLTFGKVGPVYNSSSRHWSDPNLPGLERLRGHEFPAQLKWFNRALRFFLQHVQAHRWLRLQRPCSAVLSHWSLCLPIRWSPIRRDKVDRWLQRHLPGGATKRRAFGLACLPTAGSDPTMAVAVPPDLQRSLVQSWQSQ